MNKRKKILYHYLRKADIEDVINTNKEGSGPLLSVLRFYKRIKFDEVIYFFDFTSDEIEDIYMKTLEKSSIRYNEDSHSVSTEFTKFKGNYKKIIAQYFKDSIRFKSTFELYEKKNQYNSDFGEMDMFHRLSYHSKTDEIYTIYNLSGNATSDLFIHPRKDFFANIKVIANKNDFPNGIRRFYFNYDMFGNYDGSKYDYRFYSEDEDEDYDEEIRETFEELITIDPEFMKLISFTKEVAKSNANVLLLGETGTGKELFANAIHNSSGRKGKFIAENCATFSRELMGSELFGHVKGAFTGAIKDTIGRIQAADNGTLFLDEIGDLPLEVQTNLLRVLQEKKFRKVGDNELIDVDFRLICATNKPITSILDKEFRKDLYFRINGIPIELPPLRDRDKNDIQRLLAHFLNKEKIKKNKHKKYQSIIFTKSVISELKKYEWPGNVRELQNFVSQAFLWASYLSSNINDDILNKCLILKQNENRYSDETIKKYESKNIKISKPDEYDKLYSVKFFEGFRLDEFINTIKKGYLKEALIQKDDQTHAGKLLGYSQSTINRLKKKFDL